MLDHLGPDRVIERIEAEGGDVPAMLEVLRDADASTSTATTSYLGVDGTYHPIV